MVDNEMDEADQFLDAMIEKVHGRFINEEDFPKSGLKGYKEFVDRYIEYRYEPLVEEYDEVVACS